MYINSGYFATAPNTVIKVVLVQQPDFTQQ